MAKKKTFTVQFVDQSVVPIPKQPLKAIVQKVPSIPQNPVSVIKRGTILPFSFDDEEYADVETLTEAVVVELSSERAIPACINRAQYIAMTMGDRITLPAGCKVRFDSTRNQIIILEGIESSYPIPHGFVLVFSDTLHFGKDQSIRFTNCAGFVPVGSSFRVCAYKQISHHFSVDELKEDLLPSMEEPTIISIN